jgi:Ferritin-like
MIMCQYLFAEFSLKQGTDEGLTAEQAEVVDRWRATLHSIAVEEMLHLALVANLSTAIGAAPTFGRPNFPQRSGYFPSPIQLDLQPFGEQALQHFLYLERPEGMERQDARGFVPTAPPREPLAADSTNHHRHLDAESYRSGIPMHKRDSALSADLRIGSLPGGPMLPRALPAENN